MPVTVATPDTLVSKLSRWRLWVYAALAVLLGTLVVQAGHKLMTELSYGEIVGAVRATPALALALSVLATAGSLLSAAAGARALWRRLGHLRRAAFGGWRLGRYRRGARRQAHGDRHAVRLRHRGPRHGFPSVPITQVTLPGDHDFNGEYQKLAHEILGRTR